MIENGGQKPGYKQGDLARVPSWHTGQPVCHGSQTGGGAKRMAAVAPPALGRSVGSKADEGSREGDVWAQSRPGVPLPAVKPEPWGVWHTELLSSFPMQLPGQHCGLLCVPMRIGAPAPGCLRAEAEVEGQRDDELVHGCDLWAKCGAGGLSQAQGGKGTTTAQRRRTWDA